MEKNNFRDRLRSFWDFLILFSGISTARNLSRTRKEPIQPRGLFLFRKTRTGNSADSQNIR
jgi:hypothetical protein